jgi:hypothetical protein
MCNKLSNSKGNKFKTEQQRIKASKRKYNIKEGAKISFTVLLLYVVGQLAAVYQTRYQLVSPIIAESIVNNIKVLSFIDD